MEISRIITALNNAGIIKGIKGSLPAHIKGIALDSRQIKKGYIFIAVKGTKDSGANYIEEAIKNGASCIILQHDFHHSPDIPAIYVSNPRKAAAIVSSVFYENNENLPINIVAVTGTNGKTTFTHLLEAILRACGYKTGIIGTIYYKINDKVINAPLTTPDPVRLNMLISEMKSQGVTHLLIEASSHAIDQFRLWGIPIKCAVFTNLGRDHLDYHADIQGYFNAKKRLFFEYQPVASVVNIDDAYGKRLWEELRENGRGVITYGINNKDADIRAKEIMTSFKGTKMKVALQVNNTDNPGIIKGGNDIIEIEIISRLIGRFNAYNILSAIGGAIALTIPYPAIIDGISRCPYVSGRCEPVESRPGLNIFVDYAHTPDAVKAILKEIRRIGALDEGNGRIISSPKTNIITVIGCGGDRDAGKRPVMGEIASQFSDTAIFTTDNPRNEPPESIIDAMLTGVSRGADVRCVINRADAIRYAIEIANHRKLKGGQCNILILGKGHEQFQIVKDKKLRFSDKEAVRDALCSIDNRSRRDNGDKTGGALKYDNLFEMRRTGSLSITTDELIKWTKSHIEKGEDGQRIASIATDSRFIFYGDAFIAIKGERTDGHKFIRDAIKKGAMGIISGLNIDGLLSKGLIEKQDIEKIKFFITSSDTVSFLGELARRYKQLLSLPSIAITGSCGKTTTKEIVISVLSQRYNVIGTYKNLNNLIGLPVTILNAGPGHDAAVLELGMNRAGEIKRLTQIASPAIGAVTNIRPSHLEGLKSIEAIAEEKLTLFHAMPEDSICCINLDDTYIKRDLHKIRQKKIGYTINTAITENELKNAGKDFEKIIKLNNIKKREANNIEVDIELYEYPASSHSIHAIKSPLMGMGNVQNLLCAISICLAYRMDMDEIIKGIEGVSPVDGRLCLIKAPKMGWNIIDDTYNANPASLVNAISTLKELGNGNCLCAIIGDMYELGQKAGEYHIEIAKALSDAGVSIALFAGRFSSIMKKTFNNHSHKGMAMAFCDTDALLDNIAGKKTDLFPEGSWILIKGSRKMAMERAVRLMVEK